MPCVVALGALTLLAAVLRFATLDSQSFWFDESVTVQLLQRGFGDMLAEIPQSESTPPLYYALAWLWSKPFGLGEAGLRSLSALLGTATVPVVYAAARELCSRRVGLGVAGLAAVSPVLVWYSQEARSYALLVLLAGLSLWAFARLLRQASMRALAGWAAASALALATHYFAAFLIAPEAVWLGVALGRRAAPGIAVVSLAAAGLAPLALHQESLELASFIAGDSLGFRLARAGKNFLLGFDSPLEIACSAIAAAVALTGVALALARPAAALRRGTLVAAVLALAGLALPLILALAGVDYLDTRNLLAAWIPAMTVVTAGLATRRAGVAALAVLGVLGLASIVGVAAEPGWQREDWRGMARALGPAPEPRVIVAPAMGRRPLELYIRGLVDLPPAQGVAREIALIYPVRRKPGEEHPVPPPRVGAPRLGDFKTVRRRRTESYVLAVLRAPRPAPVDVAGPLSIRPVQAERSAVLLQR